MEWWKDSESGIFAIFHPKSRKKHCMLLPMKIALVHELLTMRGGAERVLRILAEMFPEAPIYTLLYDEKKLSDWFPKERVRTSTIRPLLGSYNHHLYLRQFPRAVEAWDFSEFDLVISTSSAFAHGIITNGKPKHLCFVHSPARYLWDRTHDVLREASKGMFGFLKKHYLSHIFHKLRIWDSETADRPDKLLAASKIVKRRIELYWRRESDVVYPPIDNFWLQERKPINDQMQNPHYFLIVSSLVRYKRIDLAIEACNALKLHLKIIGEGPDAERLKKLAGPTIEFYGWRQNDELADLYTSAQATIFPGDEDFGLVPLESMACGTPVIAYRSGGALETMVEHVTGEFFDDSTAESLQKVLTTFDGKKYSRNACREQSKKFSREEFEKKIKDAVNTLMKNRG
ncbi:glycosyltransferase family 4 protein [Candidatus Peribacteria bacterium]|nr:glycosyltransferase family 4 protein [Candidatus Peribacteria bacterium]